ncbi:SPASM domain-containing protein [Xanthomonas translucens]|uniref:SPASM domain-containing protein n=1 Tax=Xanthomonas campestris pv. translucens TaxID=343 RepID=UPI0012DB6A99|nr:SPASM domain-containing protein [Xanthomonas translucens]MCC8444812.1 SPASM domain-containing protein [Xanthomonas translucens pv. translucens]MCT8287734.1 SPASM domain-containing protein [Xanthomonas translucens pv. translucens]MCT8305392.1 SPASM domain-containing protein [Xanthomonas translucens pv. translucens]UNT97820.1 SPASM domain-containing protein [Xanthomonas translucens pv. translucens]
MALYHMALGKLIRAPLFVADFGTGNREPKGDIELRTAEKLISAGYLQRENESKWLPYTVQATTPNISPISNLVVLGSVDNYRRLRHLLEKDELAYLVRHVVILNADANLDFAGLMRKYALSYELAGEVSDGIYSKVFSKLGDHVATRRPVKLKNNRDLLRIDYRTMIVLMNYVESVGTIFIDALGNVTPHVNEKHFVLGAIDVTGLDGIISGEAYQRHISNRKAKRVRCGSCELRLACLHSFVERVDPSDISSEPTMCIYDPHDESYQNALFAR